MENQENARYQTVEEMQEKNLVPLEI
uniref:Uncharacterized protein n=1 Tax=Arundo donax TaxID=35708 RepID=A0A0A9F6Y6_ARUDO